MTLAFILTMPGCGSWNGKWSGEGQLFAATRKVNDTTAARILTRGYYSYSWTDGWRAGIEVKAVKGNELRKLRKHSQGFCGYDWMIDSILERDSIKADHEIKAELEAK